MIIPELHILVLTKRHVGSGNEIDKVGNRATRSSRFYFTHARSCSRAQLSCHACILVPRGRAPFGQHQESQPLAPLAWSNTASPRFTDFPSLCVCSESSLTNLIGFGLIQNRNVVGPGQRSPFLVLTKRSAASGDENATRAKPPVIHPDVFSVKKRHHNFDSFTGYKKSNQNHLGKIYRSHLH